MLKLQKIIKLVLCDLVASAFLHKCLFSKLIEMLEPAKKGLKIMRKNISSNWSNTEIDHIRFDCGYNHSSWLSKMHWPWNSSNLISFIRLFVQKRNISTNGFNFHYTNNYFFNELFEVWFINDLYRIQICISIHLQCTQYAWRNQIVWKSFLQK